MLIHTVMAKAIVINPNQIQAKIEGILFGVLTVVLVYITVVSVWSNGKRGNTRANWDVSTAVIVGMIPAAIAGAGVGIAIAMGGLKWIGLA